MRRAAFKYGVIVVALAALVGICGCSSSSDPLDEMGQRYTASIAIQDNDEATLTIDVIRSLCDGEPEDYGPASASVSFQVADENALGVTLRHYMLEYIPLESEDGTGTIVMPPTLDSPLRGGNLGIDIEAGGSADFEITCISTDTKEEFRTKNGWLYYPETVGGQAAIIAKQAEVTAKEVEVAAKEADIFAETDADALAILNTQLELLNEQLSELEAELEALYYTFWSIPELTEARYRIRITLYFEDAAGGSRTIVREATVWLGPFDNC